MREYSTAGRVVVRVWKTSNDLWAYHAWIDDLLLCRGGGLKNRKAAAKRIKVHVTNFANDIIDGLETFNANQD